MQLDRRILLPVLDVDDVGDGEDADEPRSEVGALAPQVLRLLLYVHRVADVDLDLVLNAITIKSLYSK